jgi:hypothetical protein
MRPAYSITWSARALKGLPLRNPMIGILGCCANTESGHMAAAPPRHVMNPRRRIAPPEGPVRRNSLAPSDGDQAFID